MGLKSQPHPPAGECECPPRKSRGFRGISSPAKRAAVFHDPLDFLFERVVNIRLSERHIYADFEPRSHQSLKDLAGFSAELKALRERVQHVIECIDAARHRRNATAENEADAAYLRH